MRVPLIVIPEVCSSGISVRISKSFPWRAKMPDYYLGHDGLWAAPMEFSLLVVPGPGHDGLFVEVAL